MPNPEDPEVRWPVGLNPDGSEVGLRSLDGTPVPEVVSYIVEEEVGWVTVANPGKGLLLGYLWPTRDYPWFSIWSEQNDGKPTARGIEFGTTGLHQTGHGLVAKGKIFDRQLFRFIDADESQTFRYAAFLAKIPADYAGSARVEYKDSGVSIFERGNESRMIRLETGNLF